VSASDVIGAGALYANTFGGVGVKVSAGWATYSVEGTVSTASQVNEYATGAQLSYAGFTLGGSYRQVNGQRLQASLDTDLGANAWDVGLQYASGPYAVSVAYFKSKAEGQASIVGQDEIEFYQLSGKYNLGAGVDVLASVGHAKYEDETKLPQNENKGWAVMTGLSLQF